MRKDYEASQRVRKADYDGEPVTKHLPQGLAAQWDYSPESKTHRLSVVEDGKRVYLPLTLRISQSTGDVECLGFGEDGTVVHQNSAGSLKEGKAWAELHAATHLTKPVDAKPTPTGGYLATVVGDPDLA